ncbi:dnaJ homolog subfamily B member 3-like [Vigna umbellata]|uniref:dnaJ homolog subfamily B member 3-like n=1 Tax=Vigna umbellata TaxID=87088 RepID=UPI001F5EF35C|nr:dnaJ homolog subfamily B member 3-like [Vigna umbellata]
MAKEGEKCSEELYEVLGIEKECSPSELKKAYKKLALRWHPDRCSGSREEKGKEKFQAIQHAYSVLSDANTRLLYEVGVYDSDDDQTGMGDFLNEMATMMTQSKPSENGEESFEEFQQLFEEMFQATAPVSPTYIMTNAEGSRSNKRNSTEINFGKTDNTSELNSSDQNFCLGGGGAAPRYGEGNSMRRR